MRTPVTISFLMSFLVLYVSGSQFKAELEHVRKTGDAPLEKRGKQPEEESLEDVLHALDKRGQGHLKADNRGIELCWKCTVNPLQGGQEQEPAVTPNNDVLFKVQRSSHTTLKSDQVLVFDKVLQNIGNAYNPNTGVFVAPCRGRYLFSVTVLATTAGNHVHIKVWKNNTMELGHFFTGQGSKNGSTGSETYVIDLEKGDQIAVKELTGNTGQVHGNGYTSFTGVLLAQK